MKHHLSMSKVSLAHICSWSFRSDAPQHPRPPGPEAKTGTIGHKLAELYVKGGEAATAIDFPKEDPSHVAEARAMFSAPVRKFLDSTPWTACEIGLRYDAKTDTTRVGPRRGEPGYEDVGDTEIPGTLDLVAVEPDIVTVIDLKTGKLVKDIEQLIVQGVAAARHYGVPQARVGYAYMRKTKCDPPAFTLLTADDVDMHAGRLSRLMRRLPVAEPVPGEHCWRCDARPSCPAYEADAAESRAADLEAAGYFG